jgi:TBC1 domain family member 8/9
MQFITAIGIVSSNHSIEKLKILFILHLPPLLLPQEIEDDVPNYSLENPENCMEAEDFFV